MWPLRSRHSKSVISVLTSVADHLQRATWVRNHLQHHRMPVDEAPEDDEVRETYNFAPGYHGLVYRADVPDYGAGHRERQNTEATEDHDASDGPSQATADEGDKEIRYKLQAMKWGTWLFLLLEFYGL